MSVIFYKKKPIIGLDITNTGIRVMSFDAAKGLVRGYGSISLDPEKISNSLEGSEEYMIERLSELFKKNIVGRLGNARAVVGVSTTRTFERTFMLPVKNLNNLKESVNLEVEQYIPMPIEQLYIDSHVIRQDKEMATVLMCAAPRSFIDNLMNILRTIGLEVEMIEPRINAVARLLRYTEEGDLPTMIVDIGPISTDLAILDGDIRVTGGLSIGGNTLTLDISKHLSVPLETAHQLKVLNGLSAGPRQEKLTSALRPSLRRLTQEVQKVLRYYTERFPGEKKIEQVLIVGSGSNVPGLGDYFTNELVMAARVASPWQRIDFGEHAPSKQLRPRYMTSAGLALVKSEEVWQ